MHNYIRWAAISKQMPNRTDNDIKNHWNSCLKKRLIKSGIDPMTHEPIVTVEATSSSTTSSLATSPSSSSPSSSLCSGSARLLNTLASGISSRKQRLDTIKTMIFSEPRQAVEEKKMESKEEEEEEATGCFMEIDDEKLISTTSFDDLPCDSTTTGFVAFDDYSSIDPYDLHQSDFYHETEQLDLFLL